MNEALSDFHCWCSAVRSKTLKSRVAGLCQVSYQHLVNLFHLYYHSTLYHTKFQCTVIRHCHWQSLHSLVLASPWHCNRYCALQLTDRRSIYTIYTLIIYIYLQFTHLLFTYTYYLITTSLSLSVTALTSIFNPRHNSITVLYSLLLGDCQYTASHPPLLPSHLWEGGLSQVRGGRG